MNTQRPDPDPRWNRLVQRARADAPPPVDLAALRASLAEHGAAPEISWRDEMMAVLVFPRAVSFCFGSAGVLVLFTSWQLWDCWRAMAWTTWVIATPGGAP